MHPSSPLVDEFRNVPKGQGAMDAILPMRSISLNPEATRAERAIPVTPLSIMSTWITSGSGFLW